MNSRSIVRKTAFVFHTLLSGVIFLFVGTAFIVLFQYPEYGTTFMEWLKTQEAPFVIGIGSMLIAAGLLLLSSSSQFARTQAITYTKGPLKTSLGKDLFRQTIEKLWQEYFQRPDLSTSISLKKQSLVIFGQVPAGWNKEDDLAAFLSNRLLSLTGYWGDLSIHSSEVP